ncbi:hypothetical protein Syun_025439 [Stephania yunnanensis]|uniref:FAS1 domain-containing protein n=1 Tax=Stephania yunnanensis TaxID=152371 RepID=A0AAP0F0K1_9MAGN
MRTTQMLMFASTLVVLLLSTTIPTCTAKHATPAPTPTPAPSPPPNYVNLTDLLTVAGLFHKFLNLLEQTQVLDTFQNQANNTQQGITIFVPKDQAFNSLKNPSLSNISLSRLKSLILYHALPHYYLLADFKNLSQSNPVGTDQLFEVIPEEAGRDHTVCDDPTPRGRLGVSLYRALLAQWARLHVFSTCSST